jgi:cell filamentation protein
MLDFNHLKGIHKAIFGDIYSWAGVIRTINITKSDVFTLANVIETYAENMIFSKLRNANYLIKYDFNKIVPQLSYYFSELNVLHPFREGNGRTQRVFIEYLAQIAGFSIDFSLVSSDEMYKVSISSYDKDYNTMNEMFQRITEPITERERISFCKKIKFPI